MTSGLRTIRCAIAFGMLGWAAPAAACSLAMSWTRQTDTGFVRLRLRAERDTVYAGRWWLSPVSRGWRELTSPSVANFRVHGQVVRVDEVAGQSGAIPSLRAGLSKSGGRAVLVPVGHWADCESAPWPRSAAWMPVGEPSLLVARLRDRRHWVQGKPTFDVSPSFDPYPHGGALRDDEPRASKAPWLSVAEYWELLDRVPPPTLTGRRRDAALAELRAWVASHPAMAERFPANAILRALANGS